MHIFETPGSLEGYLFRLWCSKHAGGWAVDSAQIWRHREALLPKRRLGGSFADRQQAVDYGLRWCELIVMHLLTADPPPPDPEFLPVSPWPGARQR